MNAIDKRFGTLAKEKRAAFIPFLTAGDPSLDDTRRLILASEKAGADLIELGFPFSDPVADGATIQASYTRVLQRAQRSSDVYSMVKDLRKESNIPIIAMISYSLVFKQGAEGFIRNALDAGIDGATIPDLPIEEAGELLEAAGAAGFRFICFATPLTTPERRAIIAKHAGGFIYYISVAGITGARTELPPDLVQHIDELRRLTPVPIAVGFGVSTPGHAEAVATHAEGVIVGSAIVRRISEAADKGLDVVEEVIPFISKLAEATKAARKA